VDVVGAPGTPADGGWRARRGCGWRSAVDELSCGLAMGLDSCVMARLWGLLQGWARMRARVQGRNRMRVLLQAWVHVHAELQMQM
jgi:hypothetical protein